MIEKNRLVCFGFFGLLMVAVLVFIPPSSSSLAQSRGSSESGNAARGKTLFQNRCSACHTIGGGRETGPDLKGVTQIRPHEWLVEFIMDPEKMFAEKNPTAEKLLNEYAGVKMPNLGISRQQADDLLAYIRQQSQQ